MFLLKMSKKLDVIYFCGEIGFRIATIVKNLRHTDNLSWRYYERRMGPCNNKILSFRGHLERETRVLC